MKRSVPGGSRFGSLLQPYRIEVLTQETLFPDAPLSWRIECSCGYHSRWTFDKRKFDLRLKQHKRFHEIAETKTKPGGRIPGWPFKE